MEKRQIKQYGNTFAIKLEVSDMKEYKLKVGQFLDLDLGKNELRRVLDKTDEFLEGLKRRDEMKAQLKKELQKELEDAVFKKLEKDGWSKK